MLYEKINYPDNFPIHISIANLIADPVHYHTDIEFIYVLKGEIMLRNGYCNYHLREGDIFTNAGNEVHSLRAITEDNIVAQVHVDTSEFSRHFPNLKKACYRTYSKDDDDERYIHLKNLLLQLLLTHEQKSSNYRNDCHYIMLDLIKYLDMYFNLFAFDEDIVVSFNKDNPMAAERISHIVQFIYQNYANNITLQDLSRMEHLSSYYISHIIKEFTGMSFRDFLCFARVEMSESRLLGSSDKVSKIASDVGFSTTAYYKKYFKKWFGHDPEVHRTLYEGEVKSESKPAIIHELTESESVPVIKDAFARLNARTPGSISHLNLNPLQNPQRYFDLSLNVVVRPEDLTILGARLFEALDGLSPIKVIVSAEDEESASKLMMLLEAMDFTAELDTERSFDDIHKSGYFACDTIVYPLYLTHLAARNASVPTTVLLRDSGEADAPILQGQNALLTASGYKKPAYFAFSMFSKMKGNILTQGDNYIALKMPQSDDALITIFVFNANADLYELCDKPLDLREVDRCITEFKDMLNLEVDLSLRPGTYSVIKYNMTKDNNTFARLSALDFRRDAIPSPVSGRFLCEVPTMDTYIEHVRSGMNFSITLKGTALQMISVRRCE